MLISLKKAKNKIMAYSINKRLLLDNSDDDECDIKDLEDEDINLKNSVFKAPLVQDKYCMSYLSFYLLGMVSLTPWSFYVTAHDYWMYKFRDVNSNLSTSLQNKETKLQVEFTSYLNVAACVPTVLFLIINIYLIQRVSLNKRMFISMFIMLILFILTLILVDINTDKWQYDFFVITMLSMVVLNACSAITSGSIFGIVGKFPPIYITAVNSGQSLGGIFAAITEIISLYIGASSTHTALVYFTIGSLTIFFGIMSYSIMSKSLFFKYTTSNTALEEYVNEETLQKPEAYYAIVLKKVWKHGVVVFLVVFTTTCIYPGLTVLIESEEKGRNKWGDVFFVPVVNYLIFNIGDYAGRLLAGKFEKPTNKTILLVLSFSRLIFIPLLMVCNAQPRQYLNVAFFKDYEFIIILSLFAFTNGYLLNITLIGAPKLVQFHEMEMALSIVSVFLGFGMAIGSVLGYFIIKLL